MGRLSTTDCTYLPTLRQEWRGAALTPEATNTARTDAPIDQQRALDPPLGVASAHAQNHRRPTMR